MKIIKWWSSGIPRIKIDTQSRMIGEEGVMYIYDVPENGDVNQMTRLEAHIRQDRIDVTELNDKDRKFIDGLKHATVEYRIANATSDLHQQMVKAIGAMEWELVGTPDEVFCALFRPTSLKTQVSVWGTDVLVMSGDAKDVEYFPPST